MKLPAYYDKSKNILKRVDIIKFVIQDYFMFFFFFFFFCVCVFKAATPVLVLYI